MLKQITGWLGVMLGAAGVVLCLAGILGAWSLNGPITTQVLKLFSPVETALSFGGQTIAQFGVLVEDKQAQFNATADAKPVATALESEIARVRELANIAHSLIGQAGNTLPPLVGRERLSSALEGAVTKLDTVKALARQLQDGRSDKIDALNAELDALKATSGELQTALDETTGNLVGLKERVPFWVNVGSLIATLFFLWFGVAQYHLLRNSWHWVRG